MHVNYYCDTCGKAYPNEKEAMACEKKHEEDARIAKEFEEARVLAKEKIEKAEESLEQLKTEYEEKYGCSYYEEEMEDCSDFDVEDLLNAISELLNA